MTCENTRRDSVAICYLFKTIAEQFAVDRENHRRFGANVGGLWVDGIQNEGQKLGNERGTAQFFL